MIRLFVITTFLLLLVSCDSRPVADLAVFEEVGSGQAPYRTRMIATRDFLRIDDGNDDGNFLLYDRKKKSIHNVNKPEKLVLNIYSQEVSVDSPLKLENETVNRKTDAPPVSGRQLKNFLFITNGQVCFDVHSADALLGTLLKSLAEYRRALSGEQAAMLAVTPAEMLNGCDLANNIYAPDRHLGKGFPVSQKEFTGRSRLLVDFSENHKIDPALFVLPPDFRQMSPQEMRQGSG